MDNEWFKKMITWKRRRGFTVMTWKPGFNPKNRVVNKKLNSKQFAVPLLTNIYQKCLDMSYLPDEWKRAVALIIPKPETLALMNEAYEDDKLSRTQVYFWYKRFKDGRKSIADDSRSGRPLTSTTDRNIGQVRVVADRKITIDNISEIFGISYDQQGETRLSICKNLIDTANNDSDFLKIIITGDETWCFLFDPQTNKQSLEWHTPILLGRRKFVLTSPKEE
ncbi:hypothetical protein LAZ67_13000492 [Cordylochernes scorpioides]|uniref:Mos1 transposase HTH domain-containing protein n=1 Tax=Cordylochernes scorpioides TaxID=51811 RepID=A0ABY6L310_9ARAC|nr:hypothetical protein LAZ67_13000492 [Cordylochernes scorpioides]